MTSSADPRRGPLPPTLFLASLVVQGALHAIVPIFRVVPDGVRLLGVLPIVGGVVLAAVADGRFKSAKTPVNPFGEPSALVTTGPFRYSRNPMYLGMLLIQVGVATILGTLAPFLVTPAFAWLISARFIEMEEAKMARVFGESYERYQGSVRRWI